ncbi:MAG: NTP transferase domain-containing protein [Candidatus Riflebacteria bacterium]|nr:NTP transferase domain-containing protein [Candidatus Riflebacteria bacterium]
MQAIVLAGGRGTRLAPYTTVFPKPLMPLGEMPIIEIVLRRLARSGFREVTLSVGYLAELLMAYCGDGARFGVNLRYSREDQPLGTAGPLALVGPLQETFLVMNGDLLTDLDFPAMLQRHRSSGAIATLASFTREVKIDFGVLDIDHQQQVTNYTEKPRFTYQVSTGIYFFEPRVLERIIPGKRMDLPDLVLELLAAGETVACHPHAGEWLDIGRVDDYQRAIVEFERDRARYLSEEVP